MSKEILLQNYNEDDLNVRWYIDGPNKYYAKSKIFL